MAGGALRGHAWRVLWCHRSVVLLLVTCHALYRGTRVLTIDVAVCADPCKMRPRQRKRRLVVIERRRTPPSRRMAPCTICRETRTMLRIGRRIVLCHVTRGTLHRNPNVLTRCVAVRTDLRQVSTRQSE